MKNIPSKIFRILFALRDAEIFHYKHILLTVARRGHKIRIVYDTRWSNERELGIMQECLKEFPLIEYASAKSRTGISRIILFYLRELLNFRRYVVVAGQSSYYRDRWRGYLPKTVQKIISLPGMERLLASCAVGALLKSIERLIPPVRAITDDVRSYHPDIIFASPLNLRFSSAEVEYLKAAVRLGIPSLSSVLTWDNLTTKGLIHIFPDRLLVWNEVQAQEAVAHQFFPRERIRVTGATIFDDWIAHLSPSTTRAEFCNAHGLDKENSIILYLGSSSHMATDETWIVNEISNALYVSSNPKLIRAQIIVRPHPANYRIYTKMEGKNITVIPKQGQLRDTFEALQLFYDTLYHADAAIEGANSTAIIEAIITNKPAIAFITEEYKKTQMDTKHFNQLVSGEALYLTSSTDELIRVLMDIMNGKDTRKQAREAFVKKYIRPLGADIMAAEVIMNEIESMAGENAT